MVEATPIMATMVPVSMEQIQPHIICLMMVVTTPVRTLTQIPDLHRQEPHTMIPTLTVAVLIKCPPTDPRHKPDRLIKEGNLEIDIRRFH